MAIDVDGYRTGNDLIPDGTEVYVPDSNWFNKRFRGRTAVVMHDDGGPADSSIPLSIKFDDGETTWVNFEGAEGEHVTFEDPAKEVIYEVKSNIANTRLEVMLPELTPDSAWVRIRGNGDTFLSVSLSPDTLGDLATALLYTKMVLDGNGTVKP